MRTILASLIVLAAGGAMANPVQVADGRRVEPLRDPPSTFCRVSGIDVAGMTRVQTLRIDGQTAWDQIQALALTECRAAWRLRDCTVISCR